MTELIHLANLKGDKGETGDEGPEGPIGLEGPQGLAGVNAVANDTATASYINDSNSETRAALVDAGLPVDDINDVELEDGTQLDEVTLTNNDEIVYGRYGDVHVVGGLRIGDTVLLEEGAGIGTAVVAPIDLHGILGQSNATESVAPFLVQLCTETPWVVRFDFDADEFNTEDYDVPWLGSGYARAWWERDARAAGRRSGSVPCAIGGTGFSEQTQTVDGVPSQTTSWDPTNSSVDVNLAIRARDRLLAAIAAAPPGSVLKSIVWSQGEADRGNLPSDDEANYKVHLDALIAWLRTELGLPTLPFIISPFTPLLRVLGGTVNTDEIARALEDTPRRVQYTAFSLRNVDDSVAGESVHWSPDAQHRRGAAMITDPDPLRASAWDQALLNRDDAPARSVPGLSVSRSGNAVVITWGHPPARVVNFILETCVDGVGTVWTTQTLSAPTTHRHEMTVASGTPVWAKIAANCSTGESYETVEVRA